MVGSSLTPTLKKGWPTELGRLFQQAKSKKSKVASGWETMLAGMAPETGAIGCRLLSSESEIKSPLL